MSAEPSARPAGPASQSLLPPAARQVASVRTFHGDRVADPYAWLASKEDPETIAFLEAENAYTEALTADQEGLRETIFGEIKGRTQETDLSVPVPQGRLVVLPPDGRGPAVRAAVPLPGAAGRRARRRSRPGASRWTARKSCWTRTRWPGSPASSPSARSASARTRGGWRTRPTFPATSASRCGSRTWRPAACCRTRYPAPSTVPRGRWTARRCSTSRSTTPGGRGGCGGTRSGRRTPTTW